MTLSKGSLYPTSDLHGYKNLAPLLRLKTVGGSEGKASACSVGDPGSIPGLGRSPWRRKWKPTSVLLPRKFHGPRSLVGYSPWGRKESDTTERLHFTKTIVRVFSGLSQCLSSKQSTCNAGDMGSIPVLVRSPGGGHDKPLQ